MDIRAMLEQVQAGEMPIAQAEQMLKDLPYEDLGFAKLDHHRKLRSGFGEVVFCAGNRRIPGSRFSEVLRGGCGSHGHAGQPGAV